MKNDMCKDEVRESSFWTYPIELWFVLWVHLKFKEIIPSKLFCTVRCVLLNNKIMLDPRVNHVRWSWCRRLDPFCVRQLLIRLFLVHPNTHLRFIFFYNLPARLQLEAQFIAAAHDIESNWGAGINFAFDNDKHLLEENRYFLCDFEMLSSISIFLNKKWRSLRGGYSKLKSNTKKT